MKRSYKDLSKPQKDLLCLLAKEPLFVSGSQIVTGRNLAKLGYATSTHAGTSLEITIKGLWVLFGEDESLEEFTVNRQSKVEPAQVSTVNADADKLAIIREYVSSRVSDQQSHSDILDILNDVAPKARR